jgi:23S rRNA (adenine2030-N6)-methyltransferase
MNYRHIYHAGNFADVVKHAALVLLLNRLQQKEGPVFVLDTHAGAGRYDLTAAEAGKTLEYRDGIARIVDDAAAPAPLAPYLEAVRAMNAGETGLRWYPGSPALIQAQLRPQDRLVAVELHPEEAQALEIGLGRDPRVSAIAGDGYTALKSQLPPKERRGLALIDPPYEVTDEFQRLVRGLGQAHRRWATGVYAAWYPIKHREPVAAFHQALVDSGLRRIIAVELLRRPDDDPDHLNGTGLIVVNPPWQFAETMADVLEYLLQRLGPAPRGRISVTTLVPE